MTAPALLIGDLFIPGAVMRDGLEQLATAGYSVEACDWPVTDYDELQRLNRQIEQAGPASVALPGWLREKIRAAHLVVVHFCPLAGDLIRDCPQLELIGTCRTGLSNIDTTAGVPVINCRGRLANAVAEFTVGLIIAEARNIARGHAALKQHRWQRDYANTGRIPELGGRTVGLVGFGAIGQAVARLLAAFGMRVLAYDPHVARALAESLGVALVGLDDLLRRSDFVSLHAAATPETTGLINGARLALLSPHAYLINTSRAALVDEPALIDALQHRRLAGAALDVFEVEPLPADHPFLQLDNVTLTPHMAGGSDDAFRRSPALLYDLIRQHWQESRR